MIKKLFRFHGGVHPNPSKTEQSSLPIRVAPIPSRVILPLRQHAGAMAKPMVQVGDKVLRGHLIGAAEGSVSSNVHASTSGTVIAIDAQPVPNHPSLRDLCVTIESDGEDRVTLLSPLEYENVDPVRVRERLREAGVVGLGGAAFPSHIKVNGAAAGVQTLVINAAECEPFISCDDRLMQERAEEVLRGIELLRYLLGAERVLIGIENNKPLAITTMRTHVSALGMQSITVVDLPVLYPIGGAKQLIRVLTGVEVPAGRHSPEFGVQCFNLGTAYAAYRAVRYGEALTSRVVTVAGNVATAQNYEARLGTPMAELFALAGEKADSKGYIMGGPLMGVKLPGKDFPIVKGTNCILAATPALYPERYREMPCIRCGQCALACPVELQPHELYWFARAKNFERIEYYSLKDCIECGACSYSCPAHIPLVDYFRFAKSSIDKSRAAQKVADEARGRFERRSERLAQEASAQDDRRRTRSEEGPAAVATNDTQTEHSAERKQAAAHAALERARAKREQATRSHGEP